MTIAERDSRDDQYQTYTYTRTGNPLRLQVPALPGMYELRYVADGTPGTILARRPLVVSVVSAT